MLTYNISAGCMRLVLNHAPRAVCDASPAYRMPASKFLNCSESLKIIAASWSRCPFSTAVDDMNKQGTPKKKKDARAPVAIGNVGHRIPQQRIQLIDDTGEDLGVMHRVKAITLMDKQGLKLVLLNANKDPPVYQLMTGKQIYQEQQKIREIEKAKQKAVAQVKELSISSGIASHDMTIKLKQVETWLEKKHHVRITLRSARREPEDNLDKTLEGMVQQMQVMVGFVSMPKVKNNGKEAMCIIRPASAKEISLKRKRDGQASQPSGSGSTQSDTPPVGTKEGTEEGSVEQ